MENTMAMDGSFSLQFALQRFIAGCDKLRSFPQFDSFAKEGHMVTEEEVLNMLGEVFLHPNYTIPLMGCFWPIAEKKVDKAVRLVLNVPNLKSNANDMFTEVDQEKTKLWIKLPL